LGQVR